MRKLKLQMQITADGFVGRSNGEMDWMTWDWDDKLKDFATELTNSFDTILMGRKMAGGFTAHWESVVDSGPDAPDYDAAKIFVDTPKVVFSRTIDTLAGQNVSVETGNLLEKVTELKNVEGKDIIVYGGAEFVSSLIENNLIDEFNLFVNPTAIGEGLRIFPGTIGMILIKSQAYDCGIVVNTYAPNK